MRQAKLSSDIRIIEVEATLMDAALGKVKEQLARITTWGDVYNIKLASVRYRSRPVILTTYVFEVERMG